MASGKQSESHHRKHRRSPSSSSSPEEDKSSKRRKHRNHKHHHRHRRDKKRDEEIEHSGDETVALVTSDSPHPVVPAAVSNGGDDDVEEGEILEEEVPGEILKKRSDSDGESGEIKSDRFREDNPPVREDSLPASTVVDDQNSGKKVHQGKEGIYNGISGHNSERSGKKSYGNNYKEELVQSQLGNARSSFSSGSSEEKPKSITCSPSNSRYSSEVRARSRSRSHDREREIPRSRSVRDHQHDFVGLGRNEEWYYRHGRYGEDDRHYSREVLERERSREEREREKRREIDAEYERRKERERSMDRDRRREREIDHIRDRDRDRDNERDKHRGRTRYSSRERERRSDKDRDKGKEFQTEREKHRSLGDGYDDSKHKQSRYSRHSAEDDLETIRSNSVKAHTSRGEKLEETRGTGGRSRYENEQDDNEEGEGGAWELPDQEEEELNRIKEESRKRRQAILEKYKKQTEQKSNFSAQDMGKDSELAGTVNKPSSVVLNSFQESDAPEPVASVDVAAADIGQAEDVTDIDIVGGDVVKQSLAAERSPPSHFIPESERTLAPAGLGEGTPKSERSADIFHDDIFGDSPAGNRKLAKGDGLPIVRSGLHDNWDDAEGYYSYQFGELLDGRYEVMATHGKGVFSTVVRAKDLKAGPGEPEEVAIKIIRNNETMHKAGQTEVQILKKLVGADPENKRHCVRFLSSFKYRNHLCLVFESLHLNLREVLKKFGRNIGLKLSAVRVYAKQLFIALKHLRNCGVLHCDIKPDNMLVNEGKNVLKLCDFGNAMFAGKNEVTPYLVSRFYRAPEIILGLTYDHPLDIWSVGCCLYELYSGKVLFPGPTNNDMLRLHMELKGPFPKKMLRKGAFTEQHFDQDLNFHATEEDTVTGKTIKRMIVNVKPKDIGSIIKGYAGEDPKMLAQFKDLLDKIFILDPERRLTVSQALAHPFITGK
ncbi:PREDICTED: serine/threonine-protein kinase prpf4B-like [Tarenaya hassleriana]|uniref:serine/threonine-protein kinase prpf4B-like n=1 Tax=Tarenaya hassleriana TaxID=28532 RepID=UPI00053C6AEF|nr:PREDICTED: serine/threonine-protein kinase prpf4B-like [Tarenaya hassleriana]